jgi:SAM-dependent methyltransferase
MPAEPYSALAAGYDFVMEHVDYDAWAAYLYTLLRQHGVEVDTVVELGGGTGSLARRLQPLGEYRYVLTDGSEAMLAQAQEKLSDDDSPVCCVQADFTTVTKDELGLKEPVDAVILVYDGLNYLLDASDVRGLFEQVHRLLRPGGIAIIDQSTPANSETNHDRFVDEGATDDFSFVRENRYDPETRRHETIFTLTVDGEHRQERHVQRAYSRHEVRDLLEESALSIEASYDAFTREPAHDESYRVHWVLCRSASEPVSKGGAGEVAGSHSSGA